MLSSVESLPLRTNVSRCLQTKEQIFRTVNHSPREQLIYLWYATCTLMGKLHVPDESRRRVTVQKYRVLVGTRHKWVYIGRASVRLNKGKQRKQNEIK